MANEDEGTVQAKRKSGPVKNIKWGAPPPKGALRPTRSKRAASPYRILTDRLKQRPGEWGLIATGVQSATANHIRNRYGVETVWRNTSAPGEKSYGNVWARYVPTNGTEPDPEAEASVADITALNQPPQFPVS